MEKASPVTVAVVGSGMAGLASAFLLHNDRQQRYQVEVFEMVSCTTESLACLEVSAQHEIIFTYFKTHSVLCHHLIQPHVMFQMVMVLRIVSIYLCELSLVAIIVILLPCTNI